ncbi:putative E3 ubiquitin-protein ligase RING1a [Bienertia sinuspersici]
MPSEKLSPEYLSDETSSQFDTNLRRCDVSVQDKQVEDDLLAKKDTCKMNKQELLQPKQEDVAVSEEDLDSLNTKEENEPGFVYVDLHATRKEVQCPICLGIIKKTRTVMECLHRFCRECIDKSMRMGNNECPACRTHCASRRSLRDDPRFDELIAVLYPDIRKFEEEELAFYEEDEVRNKQIQESITQVLIKQSEALGKKRPANKDIAGPSVTKSQQKHQNLHSRKRRRRRNSSVEYQDSENNDDVNDSDKQFSINEHHQEIKPRRARSRASIELSHSPSATNLSGGSFNDYVEHNKEERDKSPSLTIGKERLSWGRAGARSNTRHVNVGDISRRRLRLAKLVDFLHNLEENDDESALATPMKNEKAQRISMRDPNGTHSHQSMLQPSSCSNGKQAQVVDLLQNRLHRLDREKTLPGANAMVTSCISNGEQFVGMQVYGSYY